MFVLLLILLELYFPSFMYRTINISPAFFLLLIIFVSFKYGIKRSIIISFFIGFTKDILIQHSWFGFVTLLTSAFGYILGYIVKLNNLTIRYISCISLILVYFYFYYLFQFSGSFIFYLELSIIKTLSTILLLYMINIIFKKGQFFEK